MPPPSSFVTISSVPFSRVVTQAEFNIANEFWFKYTATVPIVLGMQTSKGGNFIPKYEIFESDGTTRLGGITIGDQGTWWTLSVVGDYYIRISRGVLTVSNFDFTFTADTKSLDVFTYETGNVIINDDANDFGYDYPAALLDNTGVVTAFISSIPAGEMGAILPSNISFWHDFYGIHGSTNTIIVIDASFEVIASVTCGLSGNSNPKFGTDVTNNKVYVVNQLGQLWTISDTGVSTNTGYTFIGSDFPQAIGINEDGTKLYWVDIDNNGTIHVLNLTALIAASDLYTIPGWVAGTDKFARTPNDHPGDIFVMPNGNIVTWWWDVSVNTYKLIVVSNVGILLYSYDYVTPIQIDHLAYINGDSDHIIIWLFNDVDEHIGHIGRLTLATGVIDQDYTIDLFSQGENLNDAPGKFGPSQSCTIVRLQGDAPDPPDPPVDPPGGLYFPDPAAPRHDTYYGDITKKIPNPTVKTALIGE